MVDEPTNKDERLDVRIARLEERFTASEKALDLQASETHRRLDELNHAARTRDIRDQNFVSIDKFEGLARELQNHREGVNKQLHEIEGRTAGANTSRAHLFQVIGVALIVVGILVGIWLSSPAEVPYQEVVP